MKLLESEVTAMENNEDLMQENENLDTTASAEGENEEGTNESNPIETPETFTQEQVNDFVRNRLDRLYKRYGVENKEGLDDLVGKANSWSIMSERYDKVTLENNSLREENAFLKNNINPAKYDDIRAYFKGKGLEFNDETFVNELSTHNEWLNPEVTTPKTTIQTIGSDPNLKTQPSKSERERALDLFGLGRRN